MLEGHGGAPKEEVVLALECEEGGAQVENRGSTLKEQQVQRPRGEDGHSRFQQVRRETWQ